MAWGERQPECFLQAWPSSHHNKGVADAAKALPVHAFAQDAVLVELLFSDVQASGCFVSLVQWQGVVVCCMLHLSRHCCNLQSWTDLGHIRVCN